MTCPSRGDTLYRICYYQQTGGREFTYHVERVTFLEQNVADGALLPTYVCKDEGGRKFRCSTSMYYTTLAEAYEVHLRECLDALPRLEKEIYDAVAHFKEVLTHVGQVQVEITALHGQR
jgi:hypothetical protein